MGLKKHIHPLEEVDGLPGGGLEKKFDKLGGTINGNLRVTGNAQMKSLQIEEYLEVPELKYNRITATGNEFWVTDAGGVDDAWEDDDDMYVVELKSKEGEVTINFQYKDILRGIFYTTDEDGNPTWFKTAYFEVTGIINETMFHCYPLNGIAPQRFMTLARQGNKTNPDRQASVFKVSRNITDNLPDNAFNWFRVSDNPDGDIVWNELHQAAGSKIWIGDTYIYRRATFECEITT